MPRSFLAQARKIDEATPDSRSREVDFLRAAAITVSRPGANPPTAEGLG